MWYSKIPSALTALALLSACVEEPSSEPVPDPPRTVRTLAVGETEPVRVRSFPAVLEPPEITPLAFDVGGRLGRLDLRVGQDVAAGEVVATVDAVDARLRLQQAEAALTEAESAASVAREDAARQARLFDREVVSEADRDRAASAAEQGAARAEQARRALELLRETLGDTELRAPFDAIVNSIEVQAFGSISPGQPIVTLYEDGELQATVLVSYAVASTLSLGATVAVRPTDGDPAPLDGTITEIARRAPAVSSFPIVVTLDRGRPDLRSGMAVEVLIDVPVPESGRGIAIPLSALALDREADLDARPRVADVFVYEGEEATGTVAPRTVRIGAVVGENAFVVDGLEAGERVVTAGVPFLRPGRAVRLEDAAGTGTGRAPEAADAEADR